jgi:ABC-type polysaccharide/polyol phosphate export permease
VPDGLNWLVWANPLGPMLSAWSEVLIVGHPPSIEQMVASYAWALGTLALGFLFFISREREFAVRI